MSAGNRKGDFSTSNFATTFEAVSSHYKTLTGQDLETHPFAVALESYNSPDPVFEVFRKQAQTFHRFHKGDGKLIACLDLIVNMLFTLSATLGEGIDLPFSPAKRVLAGIGILLGAVRDVVASYQTLLNLFERIHFFLQRLNNFTTIQLTLEMTELFGKIMAQILSALAFSTKEMKDGRIKKFLKKLIGKTDVEDALRRLDELTNENLLVAARTLGVIDRVDDNVTTIKEVIQSVDGNVKATKEVKVHSHHAHDIVGTSLIDGYISHCFTPLQAERYFSFLLKNNTVPSCPPSFSPGVESAAFFVTSVPSHISLQFLGQSRWVLDRGVVGRGTVVPQTLWAPHTVTDKRHHVEEANLQLPIFFQCSDGRLGLPFEAAVAGRCHGLVSAPDLAPLGLKSTTHIRIVWPGYVGFKRQVQIRDETSQRNPITNFRFAYHVGRAVDAFIKSCQPDPGCPNLRWRIGGVGGIQPSEIVIIGAVNVSAGSWMPILQLNRWIF